MDPGRVSDLPKVLYLFIHLLGTSDHWALCLMLVIEQEKGKIPCPKKGDHTIFNRANTRNLGAEKK